MLDKFEQQRKIIDEFFDFVNAEGVSTTLEQIFQSSLFDKDAPRDPDEFLMIRKLKDFFYSLEKTIA